MASISEIKRKEFFDELSKTWDSTNSKSPQVVFDNITINPTDKVLDVACGTGVLEPYLCSLTKEKVIGIDISDGMIEKAKVNNAGLNVEYITGSFYDFSSAPFDKIIIYNAFPHFILLDKFKEAIYRNLKADGKFIICHSLSRAELATHHAQLSSNISRNLNYVETEADYFKDKFVINTAKEDDKSFVIVGTKIIK